VAGRIALTGYRRPLKARTMTQAPENWRFLDPQLSFPLQRTLVREPCSKQSPVSTTISEIPAAAAAGHTTAVDYVASSDKAFADSRQRLIAYLVKLNQALDQDLTDLSQALLQRF
jgi:hypothetical protein